MKLKSILKFLLVPFIIWLSIGILNAGSGSKFTGKWIGSWKNTLGESGKDSLVLKEDGAGNISGLWTGEVAVSGRQINATTLELKGQTKLRDYRMRATVNQYGMFIKYVATRLNGPGSYEGEATLTRVEDLLIAEPEPSRESKETHKQGAMIPETKQSDQGKTAQTRPKDVPIPETKHSQSAIALAQKIASQADETLSVFGKVQILFIDFKYPNDRSRLRVIFRDEQGKYFEAELIWDKKNDVVNNSDVTDEYLGKDKNYVLTLIQEYKKKG